MPTLHSSLAITPHYGKRRRQSSKMILALSLVCPDGEKVSTLLPSRFWPLPNAQDEKAPPDWLAKRALKDRASWHYGVFAQQTHGCLWNNKGWPIRPEARELNTEVPFGKPCNSPVGFLPSVKLGLIISWLRSEHGLIAGVCCAGVNVFALKFFLIERYLMINGNCSP